MGFGTERVTQELESFNQKNGIIQLGVNTMQIAFVLELNFGDAQHNMNCDINNVADGDTIVDHPPDIKYLYNVNAQCKIKALCMYGKVIAFDENSGSIRAEYF